MTVSGARFTALAAFPPSAAVTVYDHGTTTKATLFATSGGATALSNPVVADTHGNVTFYVSTGTYDLAADLQGVDTRITVAVAPSPSLAWPG
jgi:hypothetical protein